MVCVSQLTKLISLMDHDLQNISITAQHTYVSHHQSFDFWFIEYSCASKIHLKKCSKLFYKLFFDMLHAFIHSFIDIHTYESKTNRVVAPFYPIEKKLNFLFLCASGVRQW